MDPTRFDSISKLFASRKTRRSAVAGGVGLAATALGGRTLAQDATPEAITQTIDPNDPHPSADDAAPKTFYLFVQPFDGGTWAPKAGEDGVYTLTLTGAAANTVFFSDRPERIFGVAPHQQFLDGLGFTPDNPPNAAIVAQREGEENQEVLVIELLAPAYDADTQTLTYDARVLADYGEHGLAHLANQQQDYELGETFGSGSLFIDDCKDANVTCYASRDSAYVGTFTTGQCWDWSSFSCSPCEDPQEKCASHFGSDCIICADRDAQGNCTVYTYICYADVEYIPGKPSDDPLG